MFRSRLMGVVVLAVRYWDEDLKVQVSGKKWSRNHENQKIDFKLGLPVWKWKEMKKIKREENQMIDEVACCV